MNHDKNNAPMPEDESSRSEEEQRAPADPAAAQNAVAVDPAPTTGAAPAEPTTGVLNAVFGGPPPSGSVGGKKSPWSAQNPWDEGPGGAPQAESEGEDPWSNMQASVEQRLGGIQPATVPPPMTDPAPVPSSNGEPPAGAVNPPTPTAHTEAPSAAAATTNADEDTTNADEDADKQAAAQAANDPWLTPSAGWEQMNLPGKGESAGLADIASANGGTADKAADNIFAALNPWDDEDGPTLPKGPPSALKGLGVSLNPSGKSTVQPESVLQHLSKPEEPEPEPSSEEYQLDPSESLLPFKDQRSQGSDAYMKLFDTGNHPVVNPEDRLDADGEDAPFTLEAKPEPVAASSAPPDSTQPEQPAAPETPPVPTQPEPAPTLEEQPVVQPEPTPVAAADAEPPVTQLEPTSTLVAEAPAPQIVEPVVTPAPPSALPPPAPAAPPPATAAPPLAPSEQVSLAPQPSSPMQAYSSPAQEAAPVPPSPPAQPVAQQPGPGWMIGGTQQPTSQQPAQGLPSWLQTTSGSQEAVFGAPPNQPAPAAQAPQPVQPAYEGPPTQQGLPAQNLPLPNQAPVQQQGPPTQQGLPAQNIPAQNQPGWMLNNQPGQQSQAPKQLPGWLGGVAKQPDSVEQQPEAGTWEPGATHQRLPAQQLPQSLNSGEMPSSAPAQSASPPGFPMEGAVSKLYGQLPPAQAATPSAAGFPAHLEPTPTTPMPVVPPAQQAQQMMSAQPSMPPAQNTSGGHQTTPPAQNTSGAHPAIPNAQNTSGAYPATPNAQNTSGAYPAMPPAQNTSAAYPAMPPGQNASGSYPTVPPTQQAMPFGQAPPAPGPSQEAMPFGQPPPAPAPAAPSAATNEAMPFGQPPPAPGSAGMAPPPYAQSPPPPVPQAPPYGQTAPPPAPQAPPYGPTSPPLGAAPPLGQAPPPIPGAVPGMDRHSVNDTRYPDASAVTGENEAVPHSLLPPHKHHRQPDEEGDLTADELRAMRRRKTTDALRKATTHEEDQPEKEAVTEKEKMISQLGPKVTMVATVLITGLVIGALGLFVNYMVSHGEANSTVSIARSFLRQNKPKLAREQLQPIVAKGTRDAAVFAALGDCAMQLKELPEAVKNYTQAITIDPKDPAHLVSRAQAYLESGRPEEALRDANAALGINNSYPEALRVRAVAYARQFEFDKSLLDSDLYLKQNDKAPAEAYATRALALMRVKRYNEAVDDYSRAARMQPDNGEHVAGKAEALKEAKQYREAITACDKAINMLGRRIELLRLRGDCYFLNNDLDNAIKDYEAVAQINPRKENFVRCADAAMKGRQFNLAKYYYGKALEIDPKDERVRNFKELAGKSIAAKIVVIDTGTQSTQAPPSSFVLKSSAAQLVQAGIRYMSSGYYQDAATMFAAALKKQPKNVEARRQLTQCYLQLGHRQEAKFQIRSLVAQKALSPGDAIVFARTLLASNDSAEVPFFVSTVLRSNKKNFELRGTLIQALIANRQNAQAAQVASEGVAMADRASDKALMQQWLQTAQQQGRGR